MRLWGALLVLLSGAAAGLGAGESVRRRVELADKAEQLLRRLEVLVCLRREPLPEALAALHRDFPTVIPAPEELRETLQHHSFGEYWEYSLHNMELPSRLAEILSPLGRELCGGGEPEDCFARTLSELRQYREECARALRETGRVYPALGLCAGALLAIALL